MSRESREWLALLAPLRREYRSLRMSHLLPEAVLRKIEASQGPPRGSRPLRRRSLVVAGAGTFLLAFLGGLLERPLVRWLAPSDGAHRAKASLVAPKSPPPASADDEPPVAHPDAAPSRDAPP